MIENAEKLNVDTDRIVMAGWSSSGHLISALLFRLKRYNWCGGPMPRGVFSYDGFFDDRETTRSMRLIDKGWSGVVNRGANMRWMGKNFASGFIGPEAYANHATVKECKGLPPYAIFRHQDCPGCDHAIAFMKKLSEADVFVNFFMSGGSTHTAPLEAGERLSVFNTRESDIEPILGNDAIGREEAFVVGSLMDFIENDLRRL